MQNDDFASINDDQNAHVQLEDEDWHRQI